MTYAMKQKIMAAVPRLAQTILENGEPTGKSVRETVEEYTQSGTMIGRTIFFIEEYELIDHVHRAAGRQDYTIETGEKKVIITRYLKDGRKYIVTYEPLNVKEGG